MAELRAHKCFGVEMLKALTLFDTVHIQLDPAIIDYALSRWIIKEQIRNILYFLQFLKLSDPLERGLSVHRM